MIAFALAVSLLLADLPSPVTTAVAKYNTAIQELQAKRKGASVQRVFEATLGAAAAIDAKLVADLSDEDLSSLQQTIPSLRLTRDAAPAIDVAFFRTLATEKGSSADADFIAAWSAAHPENTRACTQFTSLPDAYKGWFLFSRKHKSAYKPIVIAEITRLEDDIMNATCACEDQAEVRQVYAGLAREFPTSKITQRVRQRAHDIDRGVSDIRFNCE